MKTILLLALIAGTAISSHAQLFSREGWNGAVLGGLAGSIIGHNSGRRTAEGAAIGAGAGLVLGELWGGARRDRSYYAAPGYYQPAYGYSSPTYYQPAVQPAVVVTQPANNSAVPAAAVVAPVQPAAPSPPQRTVAPASAMSSANALFGR